LPGWLPRPRFIRPTRRPLEAHCEPIVSSWQSEEFHTPRCHHRHRPGSHVLHHRQVHRLHHAARRHRRWPTDQPPLLTSWRPFTRSMPVAPSWLRTDRIRRHLPHHPLNRRVHHRRYQHVIPRRRKRRSRGSYRRSRAAMLSNRCQLLSRRLRQGQQPKRLLASRWFSGTSVSPVRATLTDQERSQQQLGVIAKISTSVRGSHPPLRQPSIISRQRPLLSPQCRRCSIIRCYVPSGSSHLMLRRPLPMMIGASASESSAKCIGDTAAH